MPRFMPVPGIRGRLLRKMLFISPRCTCTVFTVRYDPAASRSQEPEAPGLDRRLFFAIEPPDYIRERLLDLRTSNGSINWVPPERFHLTLRFFGTVDSETTERICDLASEIQGKRFLLQLEGVGVFPGPRSPRVLWSGFGHGHPHLFGLQTQLENLAVGLGFELPGSRYTPHLTVARCQPEAHESVRQWLKQHQEFGTAPFEVDRFVLLQSRPLPPGSPYRTIAEFPLD